ncbi:thioredoxin domain-containing protein [bacterium]|nr:thioredoxin domain-containing protein [bacterium]MCP5462336.1 thioredoxin domain-containing protein [bacterium]
MSNIPLYTNRLIHEKSPYLLQHAHNPVDWYPWGDEAFRKAQSEDKPIFLSIGYSTCHWCHVMERESFEDNDVARIMNETFVAVKIDREERPDIDGIYMTVCQMLTGSGGWPLTIIMTPDKKPFFAGTYIPKNTRSGRIGMMELIPRIAEVWNTSRTDAVTYAEDIAKSLSGTNHVYPDQEIDPTVLDEAFHYFEKNFDSEYGGFRRSPKFPTPHNLLFLLRYWKRTGSDSALKMVEKTLAAMRSGGIFDHIGFGFHRYSTDRYWILPHFEKMLYDQALLMMAYIEAFQATGNAEYAEVVNEIFTYIQRDMTDNTGGFYSAEDADSEGEEGKFYLWKEEELNRLFTPAEKEVFIKIYNISPEGNFNDEATLRKTGENIIYRVNSLSSVSNELSLSQEETKQIIEKIRRKLFSEREKRTRPYKDDKILTDWNGLMIAALAKAARVFDNESYRNSAEKAAFFLTKQLTKPNGRLYHRYREGNVNIDGHLDDYAFVVWGLLELYETTFDTRYLQQAVRLTEIQINDFWDTENSGFYFTAHSSEALLIRRKEIYDGAVPSGNSVSALNLLWLSRILGNRNMEEKARMLLNTFAGKVREFPAGYTHVLLAVDFHTGNSFEILFIGDKSDAQSRTLLNELNSIYIPNKVTLFHNKGSQIYDLSSIAEYINNYAVEKGKTIVYVCRNYTCQLPTSDPGKLRELLQNK